MDSHRQGALEHGTARAVDADPLDMFPSESTETEAAQPAADVLDVLEQDQFRPSTRLPLPPTRYRVRQSTNHRLVVVCMIAVSVLALLGRSALLRRSEVPARLENPSVPQLPSSAAKQSGVVGNLSDRTSIGRWPFSTLPVANTCDCLSQVCQRAARPTAIARGAQHGPCPRDAAVRTCRALHGCGDPPETIVRARASR